MRNIEEFIVPWVRDSAPYSAKHMDIAWENPDIIRLMSNENLSPPSERVLDAMVEAAQLGNLYPGSGPELRKILGEKVGLSADNVVLGNGSTDVINFVLGTFVTPGDEVILPVPTFGMYAARTLIHGGLPVEVHTNDASYWRVDQILDAITAQTKLIFICSPNNPSGNTILESDLRRILDAGIPVFFDEAYYELQTEVVTRAPLIRDYPHLMVNRTFSKAYGLAGFRLGYLYCDETLADYFNRVKIPWNVSLPAIAVALAALDDEGDLAKRRQIILEGRDFIREQINQIHQVWAYPSEGNFVLIDAGVLGLTSFEIRDRMKEKGVFIRPMSGHNLARGFFRVTVGLPEHNQLFIDKFTELVEECRPELLSYSETTLGR
jgi:histidinol-phosphate aminotransferase